MVAADRQVFQGRGAIVRRLNAGVETLAKMAGGGGDSGGGEAEQQQQPWQQQQQLLAFELEGPSPGPGGTVVVRLALKRGLHCLAFTLAFTLRQGRIALLHNTRS